MSHLPWQMRALLGVHLPSDVPMAGRRKPGTPAPHDGTAATFEFNYDAAENCTGNPQSEPGARTLVGPAAVLTPQFLLAQSEAEDRDGFDDLLKGKVVCRLIVAALHSWSISSAAGLPEREDGDGDWHDIKSFIQHKDFMLHDGHPEEFLPLVATKGNGRVELRSVTTQEGPPWVRLWLSPTTSAAQEQEIQRALWQAGVGVARLPHDVESVPVSVAGMPGMSITAQSGGNALGTLFSLARGNSKIVGKALVAYANGEMGTAGPTLEILEVAKEWRGCGLGSALLKAVESFYVERFAAAMASSSPSHHPVRLSACYVTSHYACRWFQARGFRDDDGMGEELSKALISRRVLERYGAQLQGAQASRLYAPPGAGAELWNDEYSEKSSDDEEMDEEEDEDDVHRQDIASRSVDTLCGLCACVCVCVCVCVCMCHCVCGGGGVVSMPDAQFFTSNLDHLPDEVPHSLCKGLSLSLSLSLSLARSLARSACLYLWGTLSGSCCARKREMLGCLLAPVGMRVFN